MNVFLLIVLVFIVLFLLFPAKSIKLIVSFLGHILFNAQTKGLKNIPKKGGALLISNHVSYLDFILIAMTVPRMVRFVMYKDIYEKKSLKWILKKLNMIPISPRGGGNNLKEFNELCQKEINNGHVVIIFAEGTVTRNGHMLEFKRGMEHIANGIDAPIIPVHMEGVIGSPLSFHVKNSKAQKFKFHSLRKKVFITIGAPMPPSSSAFKVRQKIQEINAETLFDRFDNNNQLALHILKLKGERVLFSDDLNNNMCAAEFKMKAIKEALVINKKVRQSKNVAVLAENNFSFLVTLGALNLLGKTPVLITPEYSEKQISSVVNELEQLPVITNLPTDAANSNFITIDSLQNEIGIFIRLKARVLSLLPKKISLALLGNQSNKSSNSVCIPHFENGKIELEYISHQSALGNVYALKQVHNIHHYGFVLNLNHPTSGISFITNYILPIVNRSKAIIHNNQRSIKPLLEKSQTIVGDTQSIETLFNSTNACDWSKIKYLISTQQEFSESVRNNLIQKYNIEVYKGLGKYGVAPIISVNTPDYNGRDIAGKPLYQQSNNNNSVGRPLPGIAIKIMKDDKELEENEIGTVHLKGALLSGKHAQKNWINSSLQGSVDEKGFLKIIH